MTNNEKWRGDLRWSVKGSFLDYVRRSGGTITTSPEVETIEGEFVFPRIDDEAVVDAVSPTGTARFGGTVRFEAHGGMLDLVLGWPEIAFRDHEATLRVRDEDDEPVDLATLQLGGAFQRDDGVLDWVGVQAALTADGASAFNNVYPAYTELDALSLSLAPGDGVPPAQA